MKILIIGFLALFGWAALATHIYVCNIKGLCYEQVILPDDTTGHKDLIAVDTTLEPGMSKQAVIPDNLLVHFGFDKSDFNSEAVPVKYFEESNAYLVQDSTARLSITGYTDAVGSDEYNQALGYRRAQGLQHYFESRGMSGKKIIIGSKGEKEPVDDNSTKEGRANNRRTAITIKH